MIPTLLRLTAVSVLLSNVPLVTAALANPLHKRMNVLLLIADDLNTWLLGDPDRYAGKVIAPNLQKLANSGVNFARAYTAAPVCSPSRTAFFSGVAPWSSGHYNNALKLDDNEALNNATSMASSFKQAGYSTFSYGKITHGWDQKDGWDDKVGHKRDPRPPNYPLTPIGAGENDWGPIHLDESEMNSTQLANLTIAQLEKQHGKPFFLACGFFNPHMPWYVPQKYFDMFPLDGLVVPELKADDLDDLPPIGLEVSGREADKILKAGLLPSAVQAYLATTAYVDTHMGRILDALDGSPHKDNTIVVFMSDHGFHLGEKNHWQKTTLWEEATHCMLMFRVPGLTPQGRISQRFVSLLDLYSTLTELCNIPTPPDVEGRSLLPLLRDPDAEWESTALTGLCHKTKPKAAYMSLRNEFGRYIRYVDGQEEYYTAADPHEWTNEIHNPKYAEVIGKLRAALPPAAPPLTSKLTEPKRVSKSEAKKAEKK